MPDGAADTVLERKAQAQRRALGVGAVSIPRALGRSLAIAADALWALGLTCAADGDNTVPTDRALSQLSNDQMMLILEKEDAPCALLAIDRALVTGVIEAQTLGKVTQFPLDDRAFTPTDAAMMAPLVDATLPRFGSMLAGQPERAHLQGYQFGALVDDVQTAALALEAARLQTIVFDIDLSQGLRSGRAVFLFPEAPKPPEGDGDASAHGKYEAAMKMVPARMQAVLTRIHLPLSKAQALKPGDVLDISVNALSSAALVVDGGHVAARGKLGQMNGFRAIRIGTDAPFLQKPVASSPQDQTNHPATEGTDLDYSTQNVAPDSVSSLPVAQDMTLDNLTFGGKDPADLL